MEGGWRGCGVGGVGVKSRKQSYLPTRCQTGYCNLILAVINRHYAEHMKQWRGFLLQRSMLNQNFYGVISSKSGCSRRNLVA